jgi:spore coat polysaccharide biosynthesis protein SpsF (cytidylyltransferase family)
MARFVVAIIQARMGSTRLPGKTMADIAGKPLLAHVIQRVRASQTVQKVVVATTSEPIDEPIERLSQECGASTYIGSTEDVLDRYYQAAKMAGAEIIVRVTADDPFKDPVVIDEVAGRLVADTLLDYASNTLEPTYPEGLDIEVFTSAALERAWKEATLPSDREHVTPYIWRNPESFRVLSIRRSPDLSSLRWTIDYEPDLRLAREVYARLYHGQVFQMPEILALLAAEPWLADINRGVKRNVGYLASLEKERSGRATPD